MLYGEGDRVVFGKDRIPRRSTVPVIAVERGGSQLKLNTGEMQGVVTGSRFGIYPGGCELIDAIHRRAVVEVIELGATDARAKVVGALPEPPLESGMQATLEHPGAVCLQSAVRVVEPEGRWLSAGPRAAGALKTLILAGKSPFVRLAAGVDAADLTVVANGTGAWEIRDAWGEPLDFPTVPPVPFEAPEAAQTVIHRLEQVTKFRNVDRLVHPGPKAPKIEARWVGQPPAEPLVVGVGQPACLRLANRSFQDLHIVALILRSDGSIRRSSLGSERAQLLLLRGGEVGLEGEAREFEITGQLAPGETAARERIKIFATIQSAINFGWLELPPWDGKPRFRPALRRNDPLEEILASLAGEWPAKRVVTISGHADQEWTVKTLELRVGA
jgi:hypothetical protein